ncbi:MAG: chorismate pyruvate-lyase family protein [Proteobacteria bacterium]|nr:chorismate pyruvate-lyase family protein [Pseudomonadota bacterium]
MLNLSSFPTVLQVLMNTDGTVTDLIQLLVKEELVVIKLYEKANKESGILKRKIYLQGETSKTNWLCAESKVYLSNLHHHFVDDLTQQNIPIGTLWTKYKMETYKKVINKEEETSLDIKQTGYENGTKLLARTYRVYNNKKIIMEITERFPVSQYFHLKF